ncbi:hypothetical protein HJ127_08520 [Vibrio parahaemolyticus]|nr:hypothetical protein [Vibrio parahaemolyticus]
MYIRGNAESLNFRDFSENGFEKWVKNFFLKDRTADLKIWRAFLELFRKEREV